MMLAISAKHHKSRMFISKGYSHLSDFHLKFKMQPITIILYFVILSTVRSNEPVL